MKGIILQTRILSVFNFLKRVGFAVFVFAWVVSGLEPARADWSDNILIWENTQDYSQVGRAAVHVDEIGNVLIAFTAGHRYSPEPWLARSGLHYVAFGQDGSIIRPLVMLTDSTCLGVGAPQFLEFVNDSLWLFCVLDLNGPRMLPYRVLLDENGSILDSARDFLNVQAGYSDGMVLDVLPDNSLVFVWQEETDEIKVSRWTVAGVFLLNEVPIWSTWPCDEIAGFVDDTDSLQVFWRQYPSWQAVYTKRIGLQDRISPDELADYYAVTPDTSGSSSFAPMARQVNDTLLAVAYEYFENGIGYYLRLNILNRETYESISSVSAGLSNTNQFDCEGDTSISLVNQAEDNHWISYKRYSVPDLELLEETLLARFDIGGGIRVLAYKTGANGTRHVLFTHQAPGGGPGANKLYYKYWDAQLGTGDPIAPVISELTISVFPNPFNSTLSISLGVPQYSDVTLSLYDLLGREVDVVYRGKLASSTISYVAPVGLASGVYFLRAAAGERSVLVKVVFLK